MRRLALGGMCLPPGGLEVAAPSDTSSPSGDFYCSSVGVLMLDA